MRAILTCVVALWCGVAVGQDAWTLPQPVYRPSTPVYLPSVYYPAWTLPQPTYRYYQPRYYRAQPRYVPTNRWVLSGNRWKRVWQYQY